MRSFKSNENIHKKEGGSYYVVSANKASEVVLEVWRKNFKDLLNPMSEHTHSHLQTEETLNSTNDDQLNGYKHRRK